MPTAETVQISPGFPDPRPRVISTDAGWMIAGWRCSNCGVPRAVSAPWCPACRGDLADTMFGPRGVVWSATVVHLEIGGLDAPYELAYVDLDDGPRVLAHVRGDDTPSAVGDIVDVIGSTPEGNVAVQVRESVR